MATMLYTLRDYMTQGRKAEIAQEDDPRLGDLKKLPGTWRNARKDGAQTGFEGRGWNMIALPFDPGDGTRHFRMLVNQFNEELEFSTTIGPVPNRGLEKENGVTDQMIFALDYEQSISQIAVADNPATGPDIQGAVDSEIHHEPGFFLNIADHVTGALKIARQGSIPHGSSVLALGTVGTSNAKPNVGAVDGLPDGATKDLASPYLAPYAAFSGAKAFKGKLAGVAGFPGFDVAHPHALLQSSIDGLDAEFTFDKVTTLTFDTTLPNGGILNIPFVTRQADAIDMSAVFWIMEMTSKADGKPKLALAYIQIVVLEFFPRFDGLPGRIRWPHVSINTMVKDPVPAAMKYAGPTA